MLPGLNNSGFNTVNVVMIVATALKHLRLMALLVCLSLAAGLFYYVYARPVYYARSLVRFQILDRPVDAEKLFRDITERDLMRRLTSPYILQRAANRLGIVSDPKDLEANYIKSVAAVFNSERNIELHVYAYTPNLARKWAATLIEEFVKDRDEKRARVRDSIVKAYTDEVKEIKQRMDEIMHERHQLLSQTQMADVAIKVEWLKRVPMEIAEANRRLVELERVRKTLADSNLTTVARLSLLTSMENKPPVVKTGDVVPGLELGLVGQLQRSPGSTIVVMPDMVNAPVDHGWVELERELEKLNGQRNELGAKYLPAHPKMVELAGKIDAVAKELEVHLKTAQNHFELEYEALQAKKKELLERLPQFENAVVDYERYLEGKKMREAGQVGYSSMYAEMEKKMGLLDFAGDKVSMHFQYLGHVELRDQVPVSPNRAKLLLLSLGVGILLAIGVPFLIEFLDHTVTSPEQVEHSHRLRALGIVPLLDKSQLPGVSNVAAEIRPVRQVIENFRVIRTNLLSAATGAGKEPQVIVVASAMPEEGKTFVAYNLARSFAQMGEETLLIDGDLRRGRIHRMFGHRSNPGLSNILAQTMTWREASQPSGVEKLSFISRGKHLEGSTELFASTAFSTLLDELRRHFKRIVIDTPPVLGLSETAMIQPFVDGVVLVIWGGRTSSQYVKSAVDALQTNRAHLYGFVLNRLDLSVTSNYYNYYNYYYYSYHYYKNYKSLEAPADLPKPPEEQVHSS